MSFDVRSKLRAESKKLEQLAEENQRHFERMLPQHKTLSPSRFRISNSSSQGMTGEANSSMELEKHHISQYDNDNVRMRVEERMRVGDLSNSKQIPYVARHPEQDANGSKSQLSNVEPVDAPQLTREKSYELASIRALKPNRPALYNNISPPTILFCKLADRCVANDIKSEFNVNAFLQGFTQQDRLLVGLHLKMFFSFYATSTNAGMLPDDLVRLCRAAGLMDGKYSFTNPDIFTIAINVLERFNEEKAAYNSSEALSFQHFGAALVDIASFRFSKTSDAALRNQKLYKQFLTPLVIAIMQSDLVPYAAVCTIKSLRNQMRISEEQNKEQLSKAKSKHDTVEDMPGVVGGFTGQLDRLVGLVPDAFGQSRSRTEAESTLTRRKYLQRLKSSNDEDAGEFSISQLQTSPMKSNPDSSLSHRIGMGELQRPTSPTSTVKLANHPAPAIFSLLKFSKSYLLDMFDRYAIASRERDTHLCEEDRQGFMTQVHFQAFILDSKLDRHLSTADVSRFFVNNCSSKSLTDGNLVDVFNFTQFVSCITEIATCTYVKLHGCDKYDALLMIFYWLDMHNGLFEGAARVLLSGRFPLHNAAHGFTSLRVWNMFDFYCSFGNRHNHGLHAQLSSVKCLKLLREHGVIGEQGASDQTTIENDLRTERISVTRLDIIFQKVITAEQKRKAIEEKEINKTSTRKRSGGTGLVKDYFKGVSSNKHSAPKRLNYSRKLDFQGFCIFLVEISIFLYPNMHPQDAYDRLLKTFFFTDQNVGIPDNSLLTQMLVFNLQLSLYHPTQSIAMNSLSPHYFDNSKEELIHDNLAVDDLEKRILKPANSMDFSAALTTTTIPTTADSIPNDGVATNDASIIAVIDQFQSLQKMTVLKHAISRFHDARIRNVFEEWRRKTIIAAADENVSVLQAEIAALHRKLAQSNKDVGMWKRRCLLSDEID